MEIIFWNVNNNKKAIDIISKTDFFSYKKLIAFAEYWEISDYITTLFAGKNYWIDDVKKRTGFIHSNMDLNIKRSERYYTHISLAYNDFEIYIWIVHLKSLQSFESASDSLNANITREIVEEINSKRLQHAMIIGDFNISFCDKTMLEIFHFNSTYYFNNDDSAEKTFEGKTRIKFYNPIASFNGDISKGPPGTYYYNLQYQSQSWHLYDIALVSYKLAQYLDKDNCEIITKLNGETLMKPNGHPNEKISDHFPIRIKFV